MVQYVKRYQRLSALVKGEHPRSLLGPVPQAYMRHRLMELSEGGCLAKYRWNGGGSWSGGPWSPDLPTDSALLFYIFAAYLEVAPMD